MATLTGQTIADSYEQLLSLPNGGLTGTNLAAITDGDSDTTCALLVATTSIGIAPTHKLYLDGASGGTGHTYIDESAADIMDFYAGGVHMLSLDDANTEVVINEGGADINFRVEGSGSAHALFVQGSNGFIGIANDAPGDYLVIGSPNVSGNYTGLLFNMGTNEGKLVVQQKTGASDDVFQLWSGTTKRLTVDDDGNVGIGVAAPIGLLHMQSSNNHIINFVGQTDATWTFTWTSANYNRIMVHLDIIGVDNDTGGDPKGMKLAFALEGDDFNPTDGVSVMDASDTADGVPLGEGDTGGGLLRFEAWGSDISDYDDTDTASLDFTCTIARSGDTCVATMNATDWGEATGTIMVCSNVTIAIAQTA